MKTNKENLERTIKSKGYTFFSNNDYNLNIIAIRTTDKDNKITNSFDDYLTLTFKINGNWKFFQWHVTTDPGRKTMLSPQNKNGTAILVPGQYKSSHMVRRHQGKYEALCQKYGYELRVYRDNNKDNVYDYTKVFTDAEGINIHKSGTNSSQIDGWSAGCIVFKKEVDFNEFMKYVNKAKDLYGNSFTVTLIESADLK